MTQSVVRLRRRPVLYWALAAFAAGLTALVVVSQLSALAGERARLGTMISVPIATSALPVGSVIGPDDVSHELRPKAFVPTGEVASVVEGRTVAAAIAGGEIIVQQRLAGGEERNLTALAPPGHRVLAVPTGDAALALLAGDRVELIRTTDVFGVDAAASTLGAGVVVDHSDNSVSIAIPVHIIGEVVAGVHTGTIELALIRPGD